MKRLDAVMQVLARPRVFGAVLIIGAMILTFAFSQGFGWTYRFGGRLYPIDLVGLFGALIVFVGYLGLSFWTTYTLKRIINDWMRRTF